MMRALLAVRFRAMLAGLLSQTRQKKKKSKGMVMLFAFLYAYLAVVIVGMMCLTFSGLAPAYHQMGLDWLYFSMAGILALALSVFTSVFMTQSQLYDAKDNDLLLSMPIPPGKILLSRMLPLLVFDLLFCGLVMIPAAVMYAILIGFSLGNFLLQLLAVLGICLLAQAISCLLGWGLHWLLGRMNKSLASALYMVVFLGVYFTVYSQAGNIMNAIAASGEAIGASVKSWVWPLYAMGRGCTGALGYFAGFFAVCLLVFGAIYWLLSVTFLKNATARRGGKRRTLNMGGMKTGSPSRAMVRKEWLHFLGSPVYLTNCGIGILMTAALAVAGVIFRGKLLGLLTASLEPGLEDYIPLMICAMLGVMNSMLFFSAPSVSLEGKTLWVLRSLPVSSREILLAKLKFHWLLSAPVMVLAGLVLSVAYGCTAAEILLCAAVPGLLAVLCGLFGMACGLQWARLDWLSEAYPCKQGMAAGVTLFAMMGLPVALGGCFFLLKLPPVVFLVLCGVLLAAACAGLYRMVTTWGVRKWEAL